MVNAANVIGVIPARWSSTRFPGKPLAAIAGKPMIGWVIEQARKSQRIGTILVATDNPDIARVARQFECDVVMTEAELPTGSDRVYAAVKNRQEEIVINIQGDEPLLDPAMLDTLVACFDRDPHIQMATLGRELSEPELLSANTAKIVRDCNGRALYFSRLPIPYSRGSKPQNLTGCLKHIGIYGYKKEFLRKYCEQEPCELEQAESLEQLRALYLGAQIQVAKVQGESWGVDVPEDITKIEMILKKRTT